MTNIKKISILLIALIFSINSLTNQLHANQLATAEKAEELRAYFQEIIDNKKLLNPNIGTKGNVTIIPKGPYYFLRLPHIKIKTKNKKIIDIGVITSNIAPTKNDKLWKIVTSLPKPIKIYNINGDLKYQININKQSFAGLWHMDIKNFVKADIKYKDIKITNNNNPEAIFSIEKASILYNLKDNNTDIWSGPANLSINNIKINDGKNFNLKIGEIYINSTTDKLNPKYVKQYNNQVKALAESVKRSEPESIKNKRNEFLFNAFSEYLTNSADGYSINLGVKNLDISGQSQKGNKHITMGHANIGMDISGLRKGIVNWITSVDYKNFEVKNAPEKFKILYPKQSSLNISINRIPLNSILKQAKISIQTSDVDPEFAKMNMMVQLPELLTRSRSVIEIKRSKITSDNYEIIISGKITPNINLPNMAKLNIKSEVTGFNQLQQILLGKLTSAPEDDKLFYLSSNGILGMIKSFGKKNYDPITKKPYWTYHILTNENGKIKINGTEHSMPFSGNR